MALAAPGAAGAVFGFFAFRSRIKGVYLSIVTQALTYAAMLLFFRNDTGFGGNNGLTDFKRIVGFPLQAPSTKLALYVISAVALLLVYIGCRFVVTSKLGRVLAAIRDAELKTRFCGYESDQLQAVRLDAVGGDVRARGRALRAAGRHHQPERDAARRTRSKWRSGSRSAGAARWSGALLGAWFVNGAKSWLTAAFPSAWLYVLGGLFVVVTLFLPKGLVGLWELARRALGRRGGAPSPATESAGKMTADGIPAGAAAVTTAGGAVSEPSAATGSAASRDGGAPSVPHA